MWSDIIKPLSLHQKPTHSTIETANRLFKKVMTALNTNAPILRYDTHTVEITYWPLHKLHSIVIPIPHRRSTPRNINHPIIVVLHESKYYLIDGGNKINKHINDNNNGPHKVAIIEILAK